VNQAPEIDQTVSANGFTMCPGGKGANACIASARLGSRNAFISKIGDDFFGKYYLDNLRKENNLNVDHVSLSSEASTSVASILVNQAGKNAITLNFGATHALTTSDLDRAEEVIKNSKVLVTSMVLKSEIALYSLKMAKKHDCKSIKINFLSVKNN
jgi:ribokinase